MLLSSLASLHRKFKLLISEPQFPLKKPLKKSLTQLVLLSSSPKRVMIVRKPKMPRPFLIPKSTSQVKSLTQLLKCMLSRVLHSCPVSKIKLHGYKLLKNWLPNQSWSKNNFSSSLMNIRLKASFQVNSNMPNQKLTRIRHPLMFMTFSATAVPNTTTELTH